MNFTVIDVSAEGFARYFLAVFFCFVGAFYIMRITLLSRRLQRPVTYQGEPGSLHWRTHQTFRVFRVIILLVCVLRVPLPVLDVLLVPLVQLWHPAVLLFGCALLFFSFMGIVIVNLYLRQEWRSGSRPGEPGRLITTGPYAYSRNPMMSLVLLGQLGFALALPSAFTLLCLGIGTWAVVAQTAVEQKQLASKFGDDYVQYAQTTPQWVLR